MRLALLLTLLFATNAQAAEQGEVPSFTLRCGALTVEAKSASGDVSNDDMVITMRADDASAELPVQQAWFRLTSIKSPVHAACSAAGKPYPALMTKDNKLILFLLRDERPGYPSLEAALIDPGSLRMLDWQTLGSMKTRLPAIEPAGAGWRVRVIRSDNAKKCDCPEAFTDDWKFIDVRGNKLSADWQKK